MNACYYVWLLIRRGEGGDQVELCEGLSACSHDDTARESRRTSIIDSSSDLTNEMYWRQFFDCPSEWWDNRSTRRNPRAPDFKHKVTSKALWIDNRHTPEWVRARLQVKVL